MFSSDISNFFQFDLNHLYTEESNKHSKKLDAIFIPTLGKRENIHTLIASLKAFSERIFVLSSGNSKRSYPDASTFYFPQESHYYFINKFDSTKNPCFNIHRNYDLCTKRSFALDYSKKNGYKKVLLIDDDITISENNVRKAIRLQSSNYGIVGLYSLKFPDKSTIDLIEALITGNTLEVSLSGNCLFLDIEKVQGFFPYVYNEDWMFLIRNRSLNIAGVGFVKQDFHAPWNDLERIQFEQFGDILALGAKMQKNIVEDGFSLSPIFWNHIVESYKSRLRELLDKARIIGQYYKELEAALSIVENIESGEFIKFINNFNNESRSWKYEEDFYPKQIRQ